MLDVTFACEMCGECCKFEIPLTLLDLHRMAKHLGVDEKTAFEEYIQETASPRSSLFMIRKKHDSTCIFLTSEKKCGIHDARPRACGLYYCNKGRSVPSLPWTSFCTSQASRLTLWEHSVSAAVTRAYIRRNGVVWNEIEYLRAILSIKENTVVDGDRKIKLSRGGDGAPLVMIYDCSTCESRGGCAKETPVTIDDVRRIASFLGISPRSFFERMVSPQPSEVTGGLQLIRNGHCVFYSEENQCSVREVQPMHCRFVPCPRRTESQGLVGCFYLGSGTMEEQFRHQVGLGMTREYVAQNGTRYDSFAFERLTEEVDRIVSDVAEFRRFARDVAPYRYVDDTLFLSASPAGVSGLTLGESSRTGVCA